MSILRMEVSLFDYMQSTLPLTLRQASVPLQRLFDVCQSLQDRHWRRRFYPVNWANMHMMGKSRHVSMMWCIVPAPLEAAVTLLPVQPIRAGLHNIGSGHHKLKSFQDIAIR
jgi:hypothetical protein